MAGMCWFCFKLNGDMRHMCSHHTRKRGGKYDGCDLLEVNADPLVGAVPHGRRGEAAHGLGPGAPFGDGTHRIGGNVGESRWDNKYGRDVRICGMIQTLEHLGGIMNPPRNLCI